MVGTEPIAETVQREREGRKEIKKCALGNVTSSAHTTEGDRS